MMLDLSAIKVEYLEVKLPDNRIINLRKPTKAMYDWLAGTGKLFNELNDVKLEEATIEYATRILNRNKERIELSLEYVKTNIPVEVCDVLLVEYTKFVHRITSNPN